MMNIDRYEILHRLCDVYGYSMVYKLVLRLQPWSSDETLGPFIEELRDVLLTSIIDDSHQAISHADGSSRQSKADRKSTA